MGSISISPVTDIPSGRVQRNTPLPGCLRDVEFKIAVAEKWYPAEPPSNILAAIEAPEAPR